ncbi:uncharacterized protein LOC114302988, partial [Camellia sinensis]|uniref:uncharacterized protein LOC114302988 n=1 Tax=Camellia sinensis TaxID=4442 RepID=UPI001035B351
VLTWYQSKVNNLIILLHWRAAVSSWPPAGPLHTVTSAPSRLPLDRKETPTRTIDPTRQETGQPAPRTHPSQSRAVSRTRFHFQTNHRTHSCLPTSWTRPPPTDAAVVEDLRLRLADTEARLERARAREADLSRRLAEMKRFVSVMEILETYLKRRFLRQQHLSLLVQQWSRHHHHRLEPNQTEKKKKNPTWLIR